jgi:hypothetical protein
MSSEMVPLYFIELVLFVFLYFALKFLLTFWFCSDKYNGVKLKFLEDNNLPVCYCREALTIGQTVAAYTVPVAVVHAAMFLLSVTINGDPFHSVEIGFMTMLFFMSFFMAFDLTLVFYVLFIKLIHKIDYISVDHHVYKMTAYKGSYVKVGGKTAKKRLKDPADKSKKRMFVKMTTCLDPECENYAKKLEKNAEVCPSCGGTAYISEVLLNVVTCTNKDCENYGQELKREIEICGLCGEKTRPLAFDYNPRLTAPAIAISLSTLVVFTFIYVYMINYGLEGALVSVVSCLRIAILAVSAIMGFFSKNKAAFIITLTALPVSIFIEYVLLIY